VTGNDTKKFATLRPGEYVVIAGLLALFAGLVVLMVTRDPISAVLVAAGIFVLVVVAISMLLLAIVPNEKPEGERDKPDTGND
jgi:predicted lysophospholipase L1 biosynthesis ABC-type transport system permease subunit